MGSPPTWAPSDALGLVDLDVIHAYIREPDRIDGHRREVELLKMPRPKFRSLAASGEFVRVPYSKRSHRYYAYDLLDWALARRGL